MSYFYLPALPSWFPKKIFKYIEHWKLMATIFFLRNSYKQNNSLLHKHVSKHIVIFNAYFKFLQPLLHTIERNSDGIPNVCEARWFIILNLPRAAFKRPHRGLDLTSGVPSVVLTEVGWSCHVDRGWPLYSGSGAFLPRYPEPISTTTRTDAEFTFGGDNRWKSSKDLAAANYMSQKSVAPVPSDITANGPQWVGHVRTWQRWLTCSDTEFPELHSGFGTTKLAAGGTSTLRRSWKELFSLKRNLVLELQFQIIQKFIV